MARAPRATSRMEKNVYQANQIFTSPGTQEIAFQLDGGTVEAQVKRIMFSAAEFAATGKQTKFKLGLFQFTPTVADFNEDEAIVLSGAIGNQFAHNETITMRVPKDWHIGIQFIDGSGSSNISCSVQLNYKVLN